jgi:AraC family transcriptional activator of mtrCDE
LPIIDIAEEAGYQSEAAFGRVFKKQLGVAPASYRRQIQQLA